MSEESRVTSHILMDSRLLPKRLLMVSNRLPYEVSRENGRLNFARGVGGLVTAVDPIMRLIGGTWIGWTGSYDELPERVTLGDGSNPHNEYRLRLVPLSREEVEEYYLGHSNRCLWPLFHNFQENCEFNGAHWDAYTRVNRKFADVIAQEYEDGDLIWVHDYHLTLVPAMIRESIPQARIGFFLHIPFPAPEIFLIESHGEKIVRGLLGSDLVGFHVDSYAENFIDAVRELTNYQFKRSAHAILASERRVKTGSYPISIAFDYFEERASRPECAEKVREIRDYYHADIVALGVDRLDYTKGILERLRSIELMLESHPELQGKFTFIQISAPSRTKVHAYQEMREKIEMAVGRINGRFGARGCMPVDYRYQSYSQDDLIAYYRASDVALVTPLRDGMNLVAKEYIASRVEGGGALVLSRFAGACNELTDAVLVNPYDPESMTKSIYEAIVMQEDEKRRRMRRMRGIVRRNDIYWWLERFLRDLL